MMMMTKQRNGKMVLRAGGIGLVAIGLLLTFPGFVAPVTLDGGGFAAGDVFISLHTGQIQWRHADGTLVGTLANTVPGKAEGMAFDAALNLFVTHHCADNFCLGGNAVERFSPAGVSMGVNPNRRYWSRIVVRRRSSRRRTFGSHSRNPEMGLI